MYLDATVSDFFSTVGLIEGSAIMRLLNDCWRLQDVIAFISLRNAGCLGRTCAGSVLQGLGIGDITSSFCDLIGNYNPVIDISLRIALCWKLKHAFTITASPPTSPLHLQTPSTTNLKRSFWFGSTATLAWNSFVCLSWTIGTVTFHSSNDPVR